MRGSPATGLLLALLGCRSSAPDAPGALLLVAEGEGSQAVHLVTPDGTTRRTLAEGPLFPALPDPRGTHALLVSAEDGAEGHRERLWLVPLAGGEREALGPAAERVRNPAWAPDGSFVVFESDASSYRDLYRVDRDGSGLTRLTDAPHGSFEPAVSPDGRRVVFGTSRDGNAEIYAMDADGTDPVRLTEHVADDVRPSFGPRGERIAWISHRGGAPRVWIAGTDGSGARPLRAHSADVDLDLAWSPDGSRLAVVVQRAPTELDVEVVEVASGSEVATLGGPGVDEHPAWSPDGRSIAWTASRGDEVDVYVARADGTGERRLTSTPGADWLPRWVGTR